MAMGRNCYAHRHRDDVPIEVHHVWPLGNGGPDRAANRIPLCSNAHSAVHDYLTRLLKAHPAGAITIPAPRPPSLPWRVRMRYGRKVRRVAEAGFAAIHSRTVQPL